MLKFITVTAMEEYDAARELFSQYAAAINIDLSFQHFDEELSMLHKMYGPPAGGIIICKAEEQFVGCIAIRKIDGEVAELKRMYVKPRNQGKGIGDALLQQAINLARTLHYKKIRLDTLNYMLPAIHLYKKAGFYEIQSYYFNPNKTAVFFEMSL